MEWDYSGRKGRDRQKKKISKANERKRKVERGKDEEVNRQGEKEGCPGPTQFVIRQCFNTCRRHSDNSRSICSTSDVPTNRRNIHHRPALLWRFFVILAPDTKLLTYLCTCNCCHQRIMYSTHARQCVHSMSTHMSIYSEQFILWLQPYALHNRVLYIYQKLRSRTVRAQSILNMLAEINWKKFGAIIKASIDAST